MVLYLVSDCNDNRNNKNEAETKTIVLILLLIRSWCCVQINLMHMLSYVLNLIGHILLIFSFIIICLVVANILSRHLPLANETITQPSPSPRLLQRPGGSTRGVQRRWEAASTTCWPEASRWRQVRSCQGRTQPGWRAGAWGRWGRGRASRGRTSEPGRPGGSSRGRHPDAERPSEPDAALVHRSPVGEGGVGAPEGCRRQE